MNNQFIEKCMYRVKYEAHTTTCFHNSDLQHCFSIVDKTLRNRAVKEEIKNLVEAGCFSLLPYRLTILRGDAMAMVSNSGRAKVPLSAQLKGSYTQIEDSPYKTYKPYQLQTGLWKVEGYQSYYAGSIGVTGANGRIDRDNADLIIVHTTDWKHLDIFVFRGLAGTDKQLDYLPDVMLFLRDLTD